MKTYGGSGGILGNAYANELMFEMTSLIMFIMALRESTVTGLIREGLSFLMCAEESIM
jgi:hypothetical protein